jgi:hypothetical protein
MSKESQLSAEWLRDIVHGEDGMVVDYTERRVGPPGKTIPKDLFGLFDMVAVTADDELGIAEQYVIGVQSTSLSNLSKRVVKMLGLSELRLWLRTGNRAEAHGWGTHRSEEKTQKGARSRRRSIVLKRVAFRYDAVTKLVRPEALPDVVRSEAVLSVRRGRHA